METNPFWEDAQKGFPYMWKMPISSAQGRLGIFFCLYGNGDHNISFYSAWQKLIHQCLGNEIGTDELILEST
jgi:hypothetical protein